MRFTYLNIQISTEFLLKLFAQLQVVEKAICFQLPSFLVHAMQINIFLLAKSDCLIKRPTLHWSVKNYRKFIVQRVSRWLKSQFAKFGLGWRNRRQF